MTAIFHASADTVVIAIESSETSPLLGIRILVRPLPILPEPAIERTPEMPPPAAAEMPDDESDFECG